MSDSPGTLTDQNARRRAAADGDADRPDRGEPAERVSFSRFAVWKMELVRSFVWLWVRLFSLKGLYALGRFFSSLEYAVNASRRRRYRRELRHLFPGGLSRDRERKIIRSYFRRTRCDKLFYLIFDKLPRHKILNRIRFRGREHIDEALARGNGVCVLLSHNGSHHVAGLLMALLGYRCAGVRDSNESALRAYMQQKYADTFPEFREVKVLYADSFPRDIFRCFSENRVVGSALDISRVRGANLKTTPVRVFDEQREFLTGPVQIGLRRRATVCQGFVVSRRNFYYRLVVPPPLYVPAADEKIDEDRLIPDIMQRYADGIETHLRKHPDHLSRV